MWPRLAKQIATSNYMKLDYELDPGRHMWPCRACSGLQYVRQKTQKFKIEITSESEAKHEMQHSLQPRFRKVVQSASAGGAYLAQ